LPDDGKTAVLTNLAITFAQSGLRTLLIDADLRRPRLSRIFQVSGSPGLAQLLEGGDLGAEHFRAAVQATAVERLHLLPSGPNPPNPAELLTGERLGKILAWAETKYDRILCDAPPILAVSDCAILGRSLDGILFVVHADKGDRVVTTRARDILERMNCRLLGVVVNGVSSAGAYGYYHYQGLKYSAYHHHSGDQAQEPSQAAADDASGAAA
jgi:capsular exopolysaccharide synthesis family protein